MKYILNKQSLVFGTIFLLFGTTFGAGYTQDNSVNIVTEQSHVNIFTKNDNFLNFQDNYISSQETLGTEYWALIFAVGVYLKHPDKNRPSMLEAAQDLYDVLLDSSLWQADHIHKVTGSSCLLSRLLQELDWLAQNSDEDDMVIVYLTTHGDSLRDINGKPLDIPPIDEADGMDEILSMYDSFENKFSFVWDDLLNFYLNKIKSKGLCLIVDSCHSGGFDDIPADFINSNVVSASTEITRGRNVHNNINTQKSSEVASLGTIDSKLIVNSISKQVNLPTEESKSKKSSDSIKFKDLRTYLFTQGFIEDVRGQNRIILMSCEEDSLSWGSDFSNFLIQGFWGWADFYGNGNGINSAEEAFEYADWLVYLLSGGRQNPTIVDNYTGEFPVTNN